MTLFRNGEDLMVADRGLRMLFGICPFTTSGAVSSPVSPGFTITKPAGTGLYRCTLADPTRRILGLAASYYGSGANHGRYFERRSALASNVFDLSLMSGGHDIVAQKAADGAAGTTTAEYPLGALAEGGTLRDAYVIPLAGVTANGTNFATLTVRKRDSAGATAVSIATLVTDVAGGNWTALARKAMTVVTAASANVLAAGSGVTLEVTKAASGVQLPALAVGLVFEGAPVDATSGDTSEIMIVVSSSGDRV